MEEIELASWMVLDAIKDVADVVETVGDVQTGHWKSVFCVVDEDFLELGYVDTAASFLRRFEDREEFDLAIESRKEDLGETPFDEDDEDFADYDDDESDDFEFEDDSEDF